MCIYIYITNHDYRNTIKYSTVVFKKLLDFFENKPIMYRDRDHYKRCIKKITSDVFYKITKKKLPKELQDMILEFI